MIRILITSFFLLITIWILLNGQLSNNQQKLPVFLRSDKIAEEHFTYLSMNVRSIHKPRPSDLEILKSDYSNIWGHLNHLHATNDVESGIEYYTENWFKHICKHYEQKQTPLVFRYDLKHELYLENWADDGLVCTLIDSNVVFKYIYSDKNEKYSKANIAIALLFEGDHWRLDAIKFLNEEIIPVNTLKNN